MQLPVVPAICARDRGITRGADTAGVGPRRYAAGGLADDALAADDGVSAVAAGGDALELLADAPQREQDPAQHREDK